MPITFVREGGKTEQIKTKNEPSRAQSLRNAVVTGLSEGAAGISAPSFTAGIGPIPVEKGLNILKSQFPHQQKLPEELIERASKIAPYVALGGGGLLAKASQLATGTIAGHLAKKLGAGETLQGLAEAAGTLRIKGPPAIEGKISQPRAAIRPIEPSKMGFITPDRAATQLSKIDHEAADIAKTIGQKNQIFRSVSESIKEGQPIKERFNKVFDSLEKTAREYNPEINAKPLNQFLKTEASLYEKTGAPTQLSRFVTDQIQGWQKEGSNSLYNMFRRFRLNNQKTGELYREMPPGQARDQMINFLQRMNNSISESFHGALEKGQPGLVPKGQAIPESLWLKAFDESNRAYGVWKNTQQVNRILDPLLQKNLTDQQLSSFIKNPRPWEEVSRLLGPEESQKLKSTLMDVQKARDAISNIKQQKLAPILLKGFLFSKVPVLGRFSNLFSLPSLWNWVKGRYYSDPEFPQKFHEFTESLVEQNPAAIQKSVQSFNEEGKEKKSNITFIKK